MSYRKRKLKLYKPELDFNSPYKQTFIDSFYPTVSKTCLVKKEDTPNIRTRRKIIPIKYETDEETLQETAISELSSLYGDVKKQIGNTSISVKNCLHQTMADKIKKFKPVVLTIEKRPIFSDLDSIIGSEDEECILQIDRNDYDSLVLKNDKGDIKYNTIYKENSLLSSAFEADDINMEHFKITITQRKKENASRVTYKNINNGSRGEIKEVTFNNSLQSKVECLNTYVENTNKMQLSVNISKCIKNIESAPKEEIVSPQSDDTIFYDLSEIRGNIEEYTKLNETYKIEDQQSTSEISKNEKLTPQKENDVSNQDIETIQVDDNCKNIKKIIAWFFSQYHLVELFTKEERALLIEFMKLPSNYQTLCFRLFTRIHKWYNIFKLCPLIKLEMTEKSIKQLYNNVTDLGLLDKDPSKESTQILIDHLMLKDLKEICESFKIKNKGSKTKAAIKELLLKYAKRQSTVFSNTNCEEILRKRLREKMGLCVKLNESLRNVLTRIHIIYSITNPEMDSISELYFFMLKVNRGEITMPTYKIDFPVIFSSREELLRFIDARTLRNKVQDAVEMKNKCLVHELAKEAYEKFTALDDVTLRSDEELSKILRRFTAGNNYAGAIFMAAKYVASDFPEDVSEWINALLKQNIYMQSKKGAWYVQLAMVQEYHLRQIDDAGKTITNGMLDKSIDEISYYELSYRGHALKNKKTNKLTQLIHDELVFQLVEVPELSEFSIHVLDANAIMWTESGNSGYKRRYLNPGEDGTNYLTVEQMAKTEYSRLGYPNGIHCEGALINTLFFLLFWEVIYNYHVPDTFLTEIQQRPLDLYGPDFYMNRKEAIDKRLQQIESIWSMAHLVTYLSHQWNQHYDKREILFLDIENGDTLGDIVKCIGRGLLTKMLQRLVSNYGLYHSGLPDLFVWNTEDKKCKFVEVKGEKDKLSMKQKIWLNHLSKIGANVEVCHVHTIGSRRSKQETK